MPHVRKHSHPLLLILELPRMPQLILSLVILPPELNWSTIEVCSLVICACIPTFRAFLSLFPYISRLLDLSALRSKGTTRQQGSSYRLESRSRRNRTDNFARSKIHSTKAGSGDNESQVEILQEEGKDGTKNGIKVTANVRIDHSKDARDSQPTFIFGNNV
jgi:hypothetical protein